MIAAPELRGADGTVSGRRLSRWRWPVLGIGGVALLAGMLAGLQRLGWLATTPTGPMLWHGALLISGFFGTVIGLERAVAFGGDRPLLAPALSAAGAIAVLLGLPQLAAAGAFVMSSLLYLALCLIVAARERSVHALTGAIAALCWVYGNGLWLAGYSALDAAMPWLGFLVLTVAGERLDLSRLLPAPSWRVPSFLAIVGWITVGAFLAPIDVVPAGLLGPALVALAIWFARFDVLRATIRAGGQPRYIAFCLAAGYVWLLIAGVLVAVGWTNFSGPLLDAALHAVFIGFVMSMVFAHAGIVLPAVLNVRLPFRTWFYLPAILLQLSVALRMVADATGSTGWLPWSGALSLAAVAGFGVSVIAALRAIDK